MLLELWIMSTTLKVDLIPFVLDRGAIVFGAIRFVDQHSA